MFMTQDLQNLDPVEGEPKNVEEKPKFLKLTYFFAFIVGVAATLGAAFLISKLFTQKENEVDTIVPHFADQQISQMKEELRFLRDRYTEFVAKSQKDESKEITLDDISNKLNNLQEQIDQFKLTFQQTHDQHNPQNEILEHLSKIRHENESIQNTQKLLINLLTLKEIKSKINKGHVFEDEFKMLKEAVLPIEGLLQELVPHLADSFPTIQDLRNQFKLIWQSNSQEKVQVEESFFAQNLGKWIRITRSVDPNSKNATLKDAVYKETIASIETQNIQQALEMVQNFPKDKVKNFEPWVKQAQLYLEGTHIQDHIDHWAKMTFKKIMKEDDK
jgi:hypothetical protein